MEKTDLGKTWENSKKYLVYVACPYDTLSMTNKICG
jgi:hypothetical protein